MQRNVFSRIAKKEIKIFFASPVAFIFLACFLAVNLFIFFWVEAFFARNIADVKPLFEWMPVLLIFLVGALTMKMWSEERRMGTLEFVMTSPVASLQFVLGKFLACLFLLMLALLLTLPIPLTVAYLGSLDWGPVIGAYLATTLLGAAYISIGLLVSSKSDNQIVSLLMTILICFCFYILGSDVLTAFVGNVGSQFLKLLGTGSRFDSITRGVIDARDLYYYLSIMGIFLVLNTYTLESQRWAEKQKTLQHSLWRSIAFLAVSNFILGNLWLQQVNTARVDLTEGNIYSISEATKNYLKTLQEPLLLRGYFSAKTHPLLAPLVPEVQNLLKEYEIAGNGKIKTELVDPLSNPELEDEANTKYGIKPVPFQVSDKYQASLVNSYFNILIQYGDQYEVLSFQELIEVKQTGETDLDVKLRNPEYDITRSIKKTLQGYQSTGDLFATIRKPVNFIGYVSTKDKLPEPLANFQQEIQTTLETFKQDAQERFSFSFKPPEEGDGSLAQKLMDEFGFRPMSTSLFSNNTFYYYLTLQSEDQMIQVALPEDLSQEAFKRNLEAGLKRFSSGFTKVVNLVLPPSPPAHPHQQMMAPGNKNFGFLEDLLEQELTIQKNDLSNGTVPSDTDVLMLIAPKELSETQLFAIDQFLMKGGTVIAATSPYSTQLSRANLTASKHTSGLEDWLQHQGITFKEGMVLDPQNAPFPIPVKRQVGGFTFQEMRMLDYPYFVDIRDQGLNPEAGMLAGLQQITLNWATPLDINNTNNSFIKVTELLSSSKESWLSNSLNILPNLNDPSQSGFTPVGTPQSYLVAAALEGRFNSYFKDKDSPLYTAEASNTEETTDTDENSEENDVESNEIGQINSVITRSAESARLIVFASNEFVTDQTLQLVSSATRTLYRNSMQLLQNTVDWSLEDRELLSIRNRGHFSRTLPNLERQEQLFWEYLNYGLIGLGIILLFGINRTIKASTLQRYQSALN